MPKKVKSTQKVKPVKLDKNGQPIKKKSKVPFILCGIMFLLAGATGVIFYLATQNLGEEPFELSQPEFTEPIYSTLTGLEISDATENTKPTYCVQIPNGSTDGARPQAGLPKAAIVFEAIAEAGITRFAAVFQNPDVSVIGPIRSLRPYYLDWDTPLDCTIVHAGGSTEALSALHSGGQRELDESNTYMWRENNRTRNWNNLFTSPAKLSEYNNSKGYNTSTPKAFPRLLPDDTTSILEHYQNCKTDDASTILTEAGDTLTCPSDTANTINITFSNSYTHNARYNYDPATNTYLRSHQDGQPHLSYVCNKDLTEPNTLTDCGDPVQLAPSAIVAMDVDERPDTDNYHQIITTIGKGKATIFQNGVVIPGTWVKSSQSSQIIFKDEAGQEIKFTPGQLWISAVPQYGKVAWE